MGKLTAMVTYYTRYRSIDKISILLLFGLGKEVAVNAIIGKPTIDEWKGCVDFTRDIFTRTEVIIRNVLQDGEPRITKRHHI